MKVVNEEPNKCTGCQKCSYICPTNAVRMKICKDGFLYPDIDVNRCIKCGLCIDNCHEESDIYMKYPLSAGIALAKNDSILENSSSGGAFFVMAQYIIEHLNGVVCGAILDENNMVRHICSESLKSIVKMQGSKYVQSELDIYGLLIEYLKKGRYVLFSGTPCQCAAIIDYCKGYRDNLFCVDIICHGVGSPGQWEKQLKVLHQYYGDFECIGFRDKSKAERIEFKLKLKNKTGLKTIDYHRLGYYSLYLAGRNLRSSCYSCRYSNKKRVGDVTIGDCASWQKYIDFHADKAISLVLINTEKGKLLVNNVLENIYYREIDYEYEARLNTGINSLITSDSRLSMYEMKKIMEDASVLGEYTQNEKCSERVRKILRRIVNAKIRSQIRRAWGKVKRIHY